MRDIRQDMLPLKEKTAIAVGMFDGVHIGHQKLLESIKNVGGAAPAVFTFNTKPAVDKLIFTLEEKRYLLAGYGIEYYYEQEFNEGFSGLPPEDFVSYLTGQFKMVHLAAGFDFRFGKDAKGDTRLLESMAQKHLFDVDIIPRIAIGGEKVSSSNIRAMIEAGDMDAAAKMMGRFYFVSGEIEGGRQLGNKLGFPTANIHTSKLLPRFGVYATIVKLASGGIYRGVTNVGRRPTVQKSGEPNIETYLLDFDRDIYGEEIRVFFVGFLRGEKKFATLDELKRQIALDSENSGKMLENLNIYNKYIL